MICKKLYIIGIDFFVHPIAINMLLICYYIVLITDLIYFTADYYN